MAAGLRALDLCAEDGTLLPARKGDPRKVALAALVRQRTAMGNEWLANRLEMGHPNAVSRLIQQGADNSSVAEHCRKLKQMLTCED